MMHPLYKHPFVSGIMVTAVEYDRLYRAMMHGLPTALAMNTIIGARRAQAIRTVYFPN